MNTIYLHTFPHAIYQITLIFILLLTRASCAIRIVEIDLKMKKYSYQHKILLLATSDIR